MEHSRTEHRLIIRSKHQVIDGQGVAFDEVELLAQAQAGQLRAFGALISHYQDRLYALAYQMLGSTDDAADVVQETFLKALKAINQFQRKSNFYTWLVRIMINLSNDLRVRGHRQKQQLAQQAEQMLRKSQASAMLEQQDPAGHLQRQETAQIVRNAIDALEPHLREAIVLRELEQFSYRQIAQIMKVSEGTVKSRIFRAREILRPKLEQYRDSF